MSYMFYSDCRHSKNPQDFLYHFEEHLASLPDPSESRKCEHFYLHCQLGFNAKEWHENFEQNSPSIITLWSTLRKHFCIKWLGTSTDILLEILKEKPVTSIQLCIATITLHKMNITTTITIPAPYNTTVNAIYETVMLEQLDHVADMCHIITMSMPIQTQVEPDSEAPTAIYQVTTTPEPPNHDTLSHPNPTRT